MPSLRGPSSLLAESGLPLSTPTGWGARQKQTGAGGPPRAEASSPAAHVFPTSRKSSLCSGTFQQHPGLLSSQTSPKSAPFPRCAVASEPLPGLVSAPHPPRSSRALARTCREPPFAQPWPLLTWPLLHRRCRAAPLLRLIFRGSWDTALCSPRHTPPPRCCPLLRAVSRSPKDRPGAPGS